MHGQPAPGSKPGNGVPITLAAALVGCLFGLRKKAKYLRSCSMLAVFIVMATICLVTGCGGKVSSSSGIPKGTYSLTITATSNGVSSNEPLTLIVQ